MNLLFRFTLNTNNNENYFETIEDAIEFFRDTLPTRQGKRFYTDRGRPHLERGDTIYFAYNSYIIATGEFTDQIIDEERIEDEHGLGLENIRLWEPVERLDNDIVGPRITNLNSEEKQNEVDRVLLHAAGIPYPDEIEDENDSLTEGAKKRVLVNSYERSTVARQRCLDKHGYSCFICEFNFVEKYGVIGENYIHVHHIIPLAEIKKGYTVDPIKDLIPVCPNCHSMIHRNTPVLSPDELKDILKKAAA